MQHCETGGSKLVKHDGVQSHRGPLSRLTFFNAIKYNIGGQEYSANDMEHGVLRGNRPTPASPWVLLGVPQWSSGYFKPSDPKAAHVRIHISLFGCAGSVQGLVNGEAADS